MDTVYPLRGTLKLYEDAPFPKIREILTEAAGPDLWRDFEEHEDHWAKAGRIAALCSSIPVKEEDPARLFPSQIDSKPSGIGEEASYYAEIHDSKLRFVDEGGIDRMLREEMEARGYEAWMNPNFLNAAKAVIINPLKSIGYRGEEKSDTLKQELLLEKARHVPPINGAHDKSKSGGS